MFTTCCAVGSDVYPGPCSEHGAHVPAALLDVEAGHRRTCRHDTPGSSPRKIRVLVVDDHPLIRAALVELLSDAEDLTVVGECEDGSHVLATAAQLRPDVVVMDLSMPVMGGLAATEALRATYPEPRVVMHSALRSQIHRQVAVAGANAVVPKGIRPDELLGCVRAVVAGCGCCPYCL
jgi:DNA-binding NarL/FixJ family response regulator